MVEPTSDIHIYFQYHSNFSWSNALLLPSSNVFYGFLYLDHTFFNAAIQYFIAEIIFDPPPPHPYSVPFKMDRTPHLMFTLPENTTSLTKLSSFIPCPCSFYPGMYHLKNLCQHKMGKLLVDFEIQCHIPSPPLKVFMDTAGKHIRSLVNI